MLNFSCYETNYSRLYNLPRLPAIYLLMAADHCLYIGQTLCLKNRFNNHNVVELLRNKGLLNTIFYIPTNTEKHTKYDISGCKPLLGQIERYLIVLYKPTYNKSLILPQTKTVYISDIYQWKLTMINYVRQYYKYIKENPNSIVYYQGLLRLT